MRTSAFVSILAMLLVMMIALFIVRTEQATAIVSHELSAHGDAQQDNLVQAYRQLLYAQIAAAQFYPMLSRRRGDEGMVRVRFVLQRSGVISRLELAESSGVATLDEAALAIFSQVLAMQLTPIPAALDRTSWQFSIPIVYQLVPAS